MRTFIFIQNGVAKVMRTYGLAANGQVITPDPRDAGLVEVVPAPGAGEEIARWHPDLAAEVSSWREIAESDIPTDATFKDAWVDDGRKITVDMVRARAIQAERLVAEEEARQAKEQRALRVEAARAQLSSAQSVDEIKAITLAQPQGATR